MSVHQQLQTALLELEAAMKAANLWRTPTPDAAAFASQQPFCIDTMSLPQWVRYVFVARLNALIDAEAAMPALCVRRARPMTVKVPLQVGRRAHVPARQGYRADRVDARVGRCEALQCKVVKIKVGRCVYVVLECDDILVASAAICRVMYDQVVSPQPAGA